MNYWLFLSDPDSYHLDSLFQAEREVWDGVLGAAAQKHLGQIRRGDRIVGYHTAPEKRVVAVLEALGDAYQNPEVAGKTNWVVDVRAVEKLPRPVPLAELKSNQALAGMALFRIPRPIAVSPLTEAEYQEILRLGGL
jgi:predicted RNA-binding protein with PUA-like domain